MSSEIRAPTVLILGSGPAGYTAAIYAARAGLKPSIVAGLQPGGQLSTTTAVDNWPGDPHGVQGPDLMERMKRHIEKLGCGLYADIIKSIDLNSPPFVARGEEQTYEGQALIIATGASPRTLGLPEERKYLGRGLSTCATCDGFFYRNKRVSVIGGGNTAMEESLYLANIAQEVILVHRREKLRADKILQDQFFQRVEQGKISCHWNRILSGILGDEQGVQGMRLTDTQSGDTQDIAVDGIFIAIGHIPNSDFLAPQLEMDNGYVRVKGKLGNGFTLTSCPGVFAAGDIADHHYRQAVTAAAMGCMAALDAKDYLTGRGLA